MTDARLEEMLRAEVGDRAAFCLARGAEQARDAIIGARLIRAVAMHGRKVR